MHPPLTSNAAQASSATPFICVKYNNGWVYDNDSAYYAFTPELSDILVAAVDFSNDTVTALVGVDGDAHGIVKGYASGNLSFTANLWGGVVNAGEFGLSGAQFTANAKETKCYALNRQRVAMARNGVVFYLHSDHLGSASLTTDASGAMVSEMRYNPYGDTRSGTAPTDRRYTGQREEVGLGLYDYGARYYDPVLARWISPDSIIPEPGNPQGLNRYTYTLGNPLRYTDPTGHVIVDAIVLIALGGAAVGAGIGYGMQVYDNMQEGMSLGDALTTDIEPTPILQGFCLGGALATAGAFVATALGVGAGAAASSTATAACADGDCFDEAAAVG